MSLIEKARKILHFAEYALDVTFLMSIVLLSSIGGGVIYLTYQLHPIAATCILVLFILVLIYLWYEKNRISSILANVDEIIGKESAAHGDGSHGKSASSVTGRRALRDRLKGLLRSALDSALSSLTVPFIAPPITLAAAAIMFAVFKYFWMAVIALSLALIAACASFALYHLANYCAMKQFDVLSDWLFGTDADVKEAAMLVDTDNRLAYGTQGVSAK